MMYKSKSCNIFTIFQLKECIECITMIYNIVHSTWGLDLIPIITKLICLPFVWVQHMFCRIHLYTTYHEFGEWKSATTKKTVKIGKFVYKTYKCTKHISSKSTYLSECVANVSHRNK